MITESAFRKERIFRVALAALALLLAAGAAFSQAAAKDPALPNFHEVSSQIFRGGQPRKGGLEKLKAMGIMTVVNLRGADGNTNAEGEAARALGMKYFVVSLPEFSKPPEEDVLRVLEILGAAENQPVFVHCRRGADRTGTVVACYRIAKQGWTAKAAKAEAKQHGLSWTQIGMRRFIDDFYRRTVSTGARRAAHPAIVTR